MKVTSFMCITYPIPFLLKLLKSIPGLPPAFFSFRSITKGCFSILPPPHRLSLSFHRCRHLHRAERHSSGTLKFAQFVVIFIIRHEISLKESEEIIGAEIREAINTFNSVFGTESNREELCNNLFAEMNKVVGLTTRECDKVVCKLAQNEELMVIFFKVDEERKFGWVKTMLEDIA
uniref:Uncharacterized protein n=2 Tax=Helianthus annuus TaxID=4232 RepID=A0A251VJV4_HELAN